MTARLDFYARRPHREQADLDLGGNGDALALHGRLMDVAFLDGGSLPSEPNEIRRRAGVSAALWRSWTGRVERKWPLSEDGSRRVNAELIEELERARRWRAERAASGKKGADTRWSKGSVKGKRKRSDGSAIAVDSELRGGEGNSEWKGKEGRGKESAPTGGAPPPLAFLSEGNGKDPASEWSLTLMGGKLWPVPESCIAPFRAKLSDETIRRELEKLARKTAADPAEEQGARAKVASWLESQVTFEKAKAPEESTHPRLRSLADLPLGTGE